MTKNIEKRVKEKIKEVGTELQIFRHEESLNCSSCNHPVSVTFYMAQSKQEAKKELNHLNSDGLCGECMCEVLAQSSDPKQNSDVPFKIINPEKFKQLTK